MAIESGTRLGPYEVAEQIGAGGMGVVYRANDTELERYVAIKVLPATLAEDADRVARFEQEAKTLAALNHPNIAHIHGLERGEGITALVMELIDGPTLADRIEQGPLPPDEALNIALQIAEGLAAAHERGIVHRDLKPANVKISDDGTVKILDFGIAKALDSDTDDSGPINPSLTTPAMTQAGMILGTAAYMSPEQARGKRVDRRSDIWAFGCVLYEMLTGQPAFGGEDVPITLARVLAYDADMTTMPKALAPAVRQTLELCLRKDPRKRIADIADVRLALQGELAVQGAKDDAISQVQTAPFWKRSLPWAAGIALAALVGLGTWYGKPEAPRPIVRSLHQIPEGRVLRLFGQRVIDISPDGRRLLYNSNDGLILRDLDQLDERLIPGAETQLVYPLFSPDGESVAFFRSGGLGGEMVRMASAGGAAVSLTSFANINPRGSSWEADGTVWIGRQAGIWRVSENGGEAEPVVELEAGQEVQWPALLPGGEWLLYTLARETGPTMWDTSEIIVESLVTGERRSLRAGASAARYAPTGHLVYGFGNTLYAVAFDPDRLEVTGGPVPVVQGMRREANSGVMQYAFADNGTLVYLAGSEVGTAQTGLAIADGNGRGEPLAMPGGAYDVPRASPDGRWVAYSAAYEDGTDIAVYEIGSNRAPRRLTFGGTSDWPVWSADSTRVAYFSVREDAPGIYWRLADGTGPEELLTTAAADDIHRPDSFSPDGEHFTYMVQNSAETDIWLLTLSTQESEPLIAASGVAETHSIFSPDGQWLAYQSTETGDNEIWVQPFPQTGAKFQLPSRGDNHHPMWSADGTQIYYIPGPGRFEHVDVSIENGFDFGNPVAITQAPVQGAAPNDARRLDIMPDGSGILGRTSGSSPAGDAAAGIVIVQNWFEELKRLVPVD